MVGTRNPSKRELCIALRDECDLRWYLFRATAPTGVKVLAQLKANRAEVDVSASWVIDNLPGARGVRFNLELEWTTCSIERKPKEASSGRKRDAEDAGSWYTATITSAFPTAAVPYEDSAAVHKLLVNSVDSVSGEVDLPYDMLLDWGAMIGEADGKHLIDRQWNHTRTLSGLSVLEFDKFAEQKQNALKAETGSGTRVRPPISARALVAHACVIYLRSDCAACVRVCVLAVSQNKLEVWVRQQLRLMYGGGFMPPWPGTMDQLRRFETVRLGNDDEELMASIEAWQPRVTSQPAAAGKHTSNPLFFAMHRPFLTGCL